MRGRLIISETEELMTLFLRYQQTILLEEVYEDLPPVQKLLLAGFFMFLKAASKAKGT
jgi:hypothetical protein